MGIVATSYFKLIILLIIYWSISNNTIFYILRHANASFELQKADTFYVISIGYVD
jgi:hypothetical protein